MGNNVSTHEKK